MKKGILLIASAALALGSTNAFAAASMDDEFVPSPVPAWYNFQGVCSAQNATITVQFDIVNKNDKVIYSEEHVGVQTNGSGIFTLHVGEGDAKDGEMPSTAELTGGGLVLVTKVGGQEVSRAPFGSVPYASQADAVGVYTESDIYNLGKWVETIEESVNTNQTSIDNIEEDLLTLRTLPVQVTAIQTKLAKCLTETDLEAYDENIRMGLQAPLMVLDSLVEVHTNDILYLQQDVLGLRYTKAAQAQVDRLAQDLDSIKNEVQINVNGIESAEQNILELIEANMENKAALNQFKSEYQEDFQNMVNTFDGLSTDYNEFKAEYQESFQKMAEFQEGITTDYDKFKADYEESFQKMAEFQDGITTDYSEFKAEYQEDFQRMATVSEEMSNAVNELQQQMEGLYEMFEGQAMTGITQLSNNILEIEKEIEANKADIDDIQGQLIPLAGINITVNTLIDKVAKLEAALEK